MAALILGQTGTDNLFNKASLPFIYLFTFHKLTLHSFKNKPEPDVFGKVFTV